MDVLDIVLIVLVVAAAIQGLRLGALVQVLTFGGFVLGLTLGALLAVPVVSSIHAGTAKTVLTLLLVLGLAVLLGVGGRVLGGWSNLAMRRGAPGRGRRRAGGGGGRGGRAALGLAGGQRGGAEPAMAGSAPRSSARTCSRRWTTSCRRCPPSSPTCRRSSAARASPRCSPALTPTAAPPVPAPSKSTANAIAAHATGSTVKVVGQACGYLQEGSGFVAAPGLVVTNAHVVAGEAATQIESGAGPIRQRPCCTTPGSTWPCCGPAPPSARPSPSIPPTSAEARRGRSSATRRTAR